ncbi:ankyrin repeat protein, putative [Trichomonas vaginalis G3]|uniref:Ankyrin repeat protein, putative n=1 Tax=Trichomonas vaginalis (strain ATCC PRA-98 / G3) TaxID=412133 RepID=A2EG03_TRIV3|nr:histone-lysine N-methyltransferase family [Trichomonas vaginalis G3]EAY08459.1 ankyrin repeat protein, putative [Trichomonas vaginalis G3]KAI5518109.1 histone-lysine N-methyltransferase family [Trichomonas vaginalis G3]|eukprot:XP_001320682.1 ankyrin repeat protein [Trichomonas vaginalis G3]
MIDHQQCDYNEMSSMFKDYMDTMTSLYRLKTRNEEEITEIYKKIKTNLIETEIFSAEAMLSEISNIVVYNNRYLRSYWRIFKMIYEEYHPEKVPHISFVFNYFANQEYGIVLNDKDKIKYSLCILKKYSLDIHKEDDIMTFMDLTENDDFNKFAKMQSNDLYPNPNLRYSLLELCCYYGSVSCFKFLITNFEAKITEECLRLSFLGGNADIMSECLKIYKPDNQCIEYAIVSHNIDFLTFLMNEYNLQPQIKYFCWYHYLDGFLVYLDMTNEINKCFIFSGMFNIPSLCEYLLSHGADINAKYIIDETPLHFTTEKYCIKTAEFFITHGVNVNAKDIHGMTALHYAVNYNNLESAKILISHGAYVDVKNNYGETPILIAMRRDNLYLQEFLFSKGADLNLTNDRENTYLHWAVQIRNVNAAKFLISHGVDVNAKNLFGKTPLQMAFDHHSKEMYEFLISHGAKK